MRNDMVVPSWEDAGAIRCRLIRTALDIALHILTPILGAGWYRHGPGEDGGRTGSVRVHRLAGAHVRQRSAPDPARANLSLMGPALTTDPHCL